MDAVKARVRLTGWSIPCYDNERIEFWGSGSAKSMSSDVSSSRRTFCSKSYRWLHVQLYFLRSWWQFFIMSSHHGWRMKKKKLHLWFLVENRNGQGCLKDYLAPRLLLERLFQQYFESWKILYRRILMIWQSSAQLQKNTCNILLRY